MGGLRAALEVQSEVFHMLHRAAVDTLRGESSLQLCHGINPRRDTLNRVTDRRSQSRQEIRKCLSELTKGAVPRS